MRIQVADFTHCDTTTGKCYHGDMESYKSPMCGVLTHQIVSDGYIQTHEAPVLQMTVQDILECINDGHSPQWIDYNETDWIEGMYEWTCLFLTEGAVYKLLEGGTVDAENNSSM